MWAKGLQVSVKRLDGLPRLYQFHFFQLDVYVKIIIMMMVPAMLWQVIRFKISQEQVKYRLR